MVGPVYPCHGYRPLSTPVTRTRLTELKLRLVSPSISTGSWILVKPRVLAFLMRLHKLWFYFFDKKRERTQKVVLNWLATSEILLEHAIRSRPSLRLSISVKESSIFLDRSSRALCFAREDGAKAVHCAGILETAKNALEQSFFAATFASRAKSRAPAHAYCGMLAARCRGQPWPGPHSEPCAGHWSPTWGTGMILCVAMAIG